MSHRFSWGGDREERKKRELKVATGCHILPQNYGVRQTNLFSAVPQLPTLHREGDKSSREEPRAVLWPIQYRGARLFYAGTVTLFRLG